MSSMSMRRDVSPAAVEPSQQRTAPTACFDSIEKSLAEIERIVSSCEKMAKEIQTEAHLVLEICDSAIARASDNRTEVDGVADTTVDSADKDSNILNSDSLETLNHLAQDCRAVEVMSDAVIVSATLKESLDMPHLIEPLNSLRTEDEPHVLPEETLTNDLESEGSSVSNPSTMIETSMNVLSGSSSSAETCTIRKSETTDINCNIVLKTCSKHSSSSTEDINTRAMEGAECLLPVGHLATSASTQNNNGDLFTQGAESEIQFALENCATSETENTADSKGAKASEKRATFSISGANAIPVGNGSNYSVSELLDSDPAELPTASPRVTRLLKNIQNQQQDNPRLAYNKSMSDMETGTPHTDITNRPLSQPPGTGGKLWYHRSQSDMTETSLQEAMAAAVVVSQLVFQSTFHLSIFSADFTVHCTSTSLHTTPYSSFILFIHYHSLPPIHLKILI